MENAIVGFAFNYSNEKIAPFLNSLNATGFAGDLILYVNDKSSISGAGYRFRMVLINFEKSHSRSILLFKGIRKLFKGSLYNTILKIFNGVLLRAIEQNKPLSRLTLAFFYAGYYLATVRFLLYYNLIATSSYSKVFFTDVNDVLFQGDIFANSLQPGVYCFEENSEIILQNNFHNAEWIIFGYGMQAYWDMRCQTIKCSGTILGTRKEMLLFLQDYLREIGSRQIPAFMIGIDQGIYNFILTHSKQDYFIRMPNGCLIYTVGTVDGNDIALVEGTIRAQDNLTEVPAVVHQYNRHQPLMDFVNKMYGGMA